jgi:hypothetical protein
LDFGGLGKVLQHLGFRGEENEVRLVAAKVFREYDLHLGLDVARGWGDKYWEELGSTGFPVDVVKMDSADLVAAGSLEELARK